MSKVAHYLQQHVLGEVLTTADIRRYFSTDGSIFSVMPTAVVYPRNENDVRKVSRFTWQLAERGRIIPMTPRGMGTDQSGAAIGSGIILVFPAHMNRILELDGKSGVVTVEPGILYGKLQQTLHTHGRFLPPYPASMEYTTIGGAIGDNTSGEKSVKYGDTRSFVTKLRVVLANGEVIETGRISKRELGKKLGLTTLEGEIYRALDSLLEEQSDLLRNTGLRVTKNSAGYDIFDIRNKDGSFDLTPLFVGSQGTLGIITEASFETAPHNPATTLIAAFFDDLGIAQQALQEIRRLPETPSAMEFVDEHLLQFVTKQNPHQLGGIISPPYGKLVALIEFDNLNPRLQKRMVKRATKILTHYQIPFRTETEDQQKEKLWKIRQVSSILTNHSENGLKALPFIEDAVVPADKFQECLEAVYALCAKYNITPAIWGHAGDAHLHMQPLLDLSQIGDRQKVFRLMDEYYKLILSMGGSTSGEHGDGRVRGPYLQEMFGDNLYAIFQKVKLIFDPYGTLNPGVKVNVTLDDIKPLLRQEYSVQRADHLPRS